MALSAFFVSGKDGVEVIRVTFSDWEEVNLCAQLCIVCIDSLHPAIPVGVWELGVRGFDHPPRCLECVSKSEEWLVMCQRERELRNGEKHDGVYSCLFPVDQWKNFHFSSCHDLTFSSAFNFTMGTAAVVYGSRKGGAGKVTLIQNIEWKRLLP